MGSSLLSKTATPPTSTRPLSWKVRVFLLVSERSTSASQLEGGSRPFCGGRDPGSPTGMEKAALSPELFGGDGICIPAPQLGLNIWTKAQIQAPLDQREVLSKV